MPTGSPLLRSVSTGEREIDGGQAAIVHRMFEEYAAGCAPRLIATRLNREALPSPRGGQWNASTINGSRQRRNGILNNELYIGRITYNRQRFVKDPDTGKRTARPNPEHEWNVKEVSHLRIVDDALVIAFRTSNGATRPAGATSARPRNGF